MLDPCTWSRWFLGLTLLIGIAHAHGQVRPTVTEQSDAQPVLWALNEAPPFHMAAGEQRGQGFCEVLVESAIRATPDLQHEIAYVPNLRVEMLWQTNQNLCFPCMILRTEGHSNVVYTGATHFYHPHGLITRPALALELIARFGQPLDLNAMTATDEYRFIQPAGRGYASLQQIIIDNVMGSLKTIILTGDHGNASMFAMIASERADYTIDYPFVMDYFSKQSNTEFAFIPILQNHQQVVPGAMACTDNAWGRQVIAEIDAQLPQIISDPRFQQALDRWMPNRPTAGAEQP